MSKLSVVALTVIAGFWACNTTKDVRGNLLEGNTVTYVSQQWYDNGDTFALKVYGLPGPNYQNFIQAMQMCQKALEVNGAAQIVGFFNGTVVNSAAGVKDGQLTGYAATAESNGLVKGMRLHDITMSKDDPSQGCAATAVISRKGLRKSVESGAFKVDNR